MKGKEQLRGLVRENLKGVIASINAALSGEGVSALKGVLNRVGRGQQLPHWYEELSRSGMLPNLAAC